jgi:hypothetical protein
MLRQQYIEALISLAAHFTFSWTHMSELYYTAGKFSVPLRYTLLLRERFCLEQCFSTAGPRPGTGSWASDR